MGIKLQLLAIFAIVMQGSIAKNRFRQENVTFSLQSATESEGSYTHVYRSSAMPLAPGEVVFTSPKTTFLTVPFSLHTIKVTKFSAEVVDADGTSVPLTEVYNHHWLVFSEKQPNAGVCGGFLRYLWGVGAESRNTATEYPDGYGVFIKPGDRWTANIHLLRTEYLKNNAVQQCIECKYAPNRGCKEAESGTFACCQDGSFCPVADGAPTDKKKYYLEYRVTWENVFNEGAERDKKLEIFVLDASNCQVEYNIGPKPSGYSITTLNYPIPDHFSGKVVFSVGHQHIGAYNISLLHKPKGSDQFTAQCVSNARYGTGNTAGDENGYLVEMSTCTDSFDFQPGDTLRIESLYNVADNDPRTIATSGMHGGVMSLFYIAAASNSTYNKNSEKMPAKEIGKIIGGVSAAIILIVAIALVIYFVQQKKKRNDAPNLKPSIYANLDLDINGTDDRKPMLTSI